MITFMLCIISYTLSIVVYILIFCILHCSEVISYKTWEIHTEFVSCICYPIMPFITYYKYLKQKNLKIEMNLKVLYKAMRFIFLPTLSVLLLLLVGFWSVTDLWSFIVSNTPGAITTRVILFIAEVVLLVCMYFYYFKKEQGKEVIDQSNQELSNPEVTRSWDNYIKSLYPDGDYYDKKFQVFKTSNPNIKIVKRV